MGSNAERSSDSRMWTVMDVRSWAVPYLTKAEVDAPRRTIELLLCAVLKTDRLGLYLQFERLLGPAELRTLREMIDRRVRLREPLQYILGSTNFYGCEISVDPRVLIPRPETEQLVERAIGIIREMRSDGNPCRVLDIGTGSGCIALAIAANVDDVRITAIDVSRDALEVAEGNAAALGAKGVTFVCRDVMDDEPWADTYDLVIANPPYVAHAEMVTLDAEVRQHEPIRALTDGADGFAFYRRFAGLFPQIVDRHGRFLLETGFGMAAGIAAMFEGWQTDILHDLEGRERIVEGRRR
ncbi:MAG: peptide chain release factor N(5)-glutamine methyltransferase [Candidatus Kapaibacterium sp.]